MKTTYPSNSIHIVLGIEAWLTCTLARVLHYLKRANYFQVSPDIIQMVFLLILFSIASAKVASVSSHISLTQQQVFLAKFGVDSNLCTWNVKVKTPFPLKAQVLIYSDLNWLTNEDLSCEGKLEQADQAYSLELGGSEDWSSPLSSRFEYAGNPQMKYIYLMSCEATEALDFDLFLELYSNDSHFSIEDSFSPNFYLYLIAVMYAALRFTGQPALEQFKKNEDISNPQFLICLAASFGLFASISKTLHLRQFSEDGVGIWTCNILAMMLEFMSSSALLDLFFCMGRGWAIHKKDVDTGVAVCLGLLNTGMFWLCVRSFVLFGEEIHSPYEGSPGLVRIIVEFALALIFSLLSSSLVQDSPIVLASFANRFRWCALAYCLAFPTIGVASWYLAAHQRLRFIAYTQNAVLGLALAGMAIIFRERSHFLQNYALKAQEA